MATLALDRVKLFNSVWGRNMHETSNLASQLSSSFLAKRHRICAFSVPDEDIGKYCKSGSGP